MKRLLLNVFTFSTLLPAVAVAVLWARGDTTYDNWDYYRGARLYRVLSVHGSLTASVIDRGRSRPPTKRFARTSGAAPAVGFARLGRSRPATARYAGGVLVMRGASYTAILLPCRTLFTVALVLPSGTLGGDTRHRFIPNRRSGPLQRAA